MKKIISVLLAVIFMLPASLTSFAALEWGNISDRSMQFSPPDKYVSMNNPPCFTWPLVSGATYDIIVCRDKALTDIAYQKNNLKYNVYNFPTSFETEIKYYWSVRYKLNGQYSEWKEPAEFIIDSAAYSFAVPEINMNYIKENVPKTHPRIIMNDEKIAHLKKIDRTSVSFKQLLKTVDDYMAETPLTAEELKEMFDKGEQGGNGSNYTKYGTGLANTAIMYFITEDDKYLEFIIERLNYMKDWDPEKIYGWSGSTDTTGAIFVEPLAHVYDWLYNELPDTVKVNTAKLIERHLVRYWEHPADSGNISDASLYGNPNSSHQWRLKQICTASLAICGDDGATELPYKIIENFLPIFTAFLNQSGEDGVYAGGAFYATSGGTTSYDCIDALVSCNLFDITMRAYYQNSAYYLLYCWPVGGFKSIMGDNYHQTSVTANLYNPQTLSVVNNKAYPDIVRGINAWMLKKNGQDKDNYYHSYSPLTLARSANSDVNYTAPTMLPNSKLFEDGGVVAMFSNLCDDNKIAMWFRSSEFGSNNHAHPDQNSFFIQALGENLVIDSDYYDYYGSTFDVGWNKKSYAHNTITYDIGEGQPLNDIGAKGKIINFLNHSDFDLAGGDATRAYKGGLSKFERNIIYIRPDSYIVIDDLKAKEGNESEFEWWINADGKIKLYESRKGLQISKNEAAVDVKIAYPTVEAYYNDTFAGPDGIEVEAPKSMNVGEDKRVYFKTDKEASTKIVSYMNVHKLKDGQPYVKETVIGNVLKLEFEDGTISYIKLDDSESVTADGYTFSGVALTVKGNSVMVIDETNLSYNGKLLFEADLPVSCAFGNDELSISSLLNEANVKIYLPDTEKITLIRDEKRFDVEKDVRKYGMLVSEDGDYLTVNLYRGAHSMYLNDKPLPGSEVDVNLEISIDGVKNNLIVKGTKVGNQIYAEYLPEGVIEKNFVIDENYGISLKSNEPGKIITVSQNSPIVINKENAYIALRNVQTSSALIEYNDEYDYYQSELLAQVRAVDYSEVIGSPTKVYWQRTKDDTLQNLNLNDSVTWEFDVPKDGTYDIVLSYSSVSGGVPSNTLVIDGTIYPLVFEATPVYSDLNSGRVKINKYLKAGKTSLTMNITNSDRMIIDWVGLLPSDK